MDVFELSKYLFTALLIIALGKVAGHITNPEPMPHFTTCHGCGDQFFPVNSILETRCPKCQPGAGGDPSTLLNTKVGPIDMATLPKPSPFSEVALGVVWPKCEDCGGELELIRPHVWDCPKCFPDPEEYVHPRPPLFHDDVRPLTPKAKFWRDRIEQQAEYIARFDSVNRTRPDKEAVKQSAFDILEMCQEEYLKAMYGEDSTKPNNHTKGIHETKGGHTMEQQK